MSNFTKTTRSFASAASSTVYDVGLRSYMLKVYNNMSIALFISGLVAFLASSSSGFMSAVFSTPLQWVVLLAPLGFVLYFNAKIHKISAASAQNYLWIFSGLMGLSLAPVLLAYTGTSVAKCFFITASLFGSMSLYGYSTKKDLTGMGSFLMMGLIGIILASLVNLFLKSPALDFVVSIIGVIIFTGLTAYDTQRIKSMYYQLSGGGNDTISKAATMGALSLYMDFINLFLMMLKFFGDRK